MIGRQFSRAARLSERRQALAAAEIPLVLRLARPFRERFPRHADDIEGAALCALVQAAADFRIGASGTIPFAAFVAYRVRYGIIDELRRLGRRSRIPFSRPEVDRLMLSCTPDSPSGPVDAADAFDARLRSLPAPEAALLRAVYRDGLTQEAYAALAGLSKARVSAIHKAALARLRGDRLPVTRAEYLRRLAVLCGDSAGIPCAAESTPGG